MVSTPMNPINKPAAIHLVILAYFEIQTLNNAINNGTNAAIMDARPPLIYCNDHVSEPLEMHNNKIPWNDIFLSSCHSGNFFPFNKKKLTNIKPEANCRTPDKKIPGVCCTPILDAM